MSDTFNENQSKWWNRVLMCRNTLTFLEKELISTLTTRQKFVNFYLENKDKEPEDIDLTEFPDMIKSCDEYLAHEKELIRRSEIENGILKNLAQEGIDNHYIETI